MCLRKRAGETRDTPMLWSSAIAEILSKIGPGNPKKWNMPHTVGERKHLQKSLPIWPKRKFLSDTKSAGGGFLPQACKQDKHLKDVSVQLGEPSCLGQSAASNHKQSSVLQKKMKKKTLETKICIQEHVARKRGNIPIPFGDYKKPWSTDVIKYN